MTGSIVDAADKIANAIILVSFIWFLKNFWLGR